MSDQITPAPRAHPNTASPAPPSPTPPTATAAAAQANFSRPTTASAAPQHAAATLPTTQQPTIEEPVTLNDKLNNVDRYWKFKGAIQVVAIILGFIGIGAVGWCVSTTPINDDLTYGYDEYWTLWPSLVTFSVSVLWCATCILFLIVKKRGVHPGLRVALELLLWLSFIVTALFAMVSLIEIRQWGEYGDLSGSSYPYGYSSSNGGYELQPNNTWVWEPPSSSSGSTSTISTSYTRPCDRNSSSSSSSSSYSSYSSSYFSSCAEQDAYINKLWHDKPHRESVELLGVVCQWFLMLLHFVLVVWACVDCHRYNRGKTSKDAEKIAANIVQTMITNGAIVPPPGQAHLRPVAPWGNQQMGYYQLPQQGQAYPMTNMYPQGQQQQYQQPPHMSGAAGPSNEKSEGTRYV
ncbi:hypothetical protein DE146DRAFT_671767 [Phaeosphaeria sp. MPI-PUGE-AT-0046c]|nr:hypothetical protein DE146DRAFT_671767 [Phaeosphaeria sp. MPI-PUGE-AT-0046c]